MGLRDHCKHRNIQTLLQILLGFNLDSQEFANHHKSYREGKAKDKGKEIDHPSVRRDRVRRAEGCLDDPEVVDLGTEGNLGFLALLLEKQVERLDDVDLPGELRKFELVARHVSHLLLACIHDP